jgi:uncharacterized iron-regulated membrane protein
MARRYTRLTQPAHERMLGKPAEYYGEGEAMPLGFWIVSGLYTWL